MNMFWKIRKIVDKKKKTSKWTFSNSNRSDNFKLIKWVDNILILCTVAIYLVKKPND